MEYIFICGNLYPYNVGGMEIFNHYLINELRFRRSVIVLSQYSKPKNLNPDIFLKFPTVFPHGLFLSFSIFFYLLFKTTSKSTIILSFSKSHWINWVPYFVLNKIKNLRYVLVIHSGDISIPTSNWIYRNLFKFSAKNLGVSEEICKEYKIKTGRDFVFMPPLIPFESVKLSKKESRIKLGLPIDSKILLYVGSLKPMKNPDTIINALDFLGVKFLEANMIHVLFVGDGIMKKEMENKVNEIGQGHFYSFLGNVGRDLIPYFYQSADVYIITSDFEGKSISLIEAMKYPLEIIGSDAIGIKTVLDDFEGNIFPKKDFRALATKLKFVLQEPNYKPQYLKSQKIFATKYSYNKFVNDFLLNLE